MYKAWMTRLMAGLMLSGLLATVSGCDQPKNHLDRVKKSGVLVVATRNSPTTYYEGPDGPAGFEYDLARRFADELGVELKILTPSNLSDILALVNRGEVDFAAAGLTVTEPRQHWVRFTPPYQEITQQLVYRMGDGLKPRGVADLVGRHVEVVADSSHAEQLEALQAAYPELEWVENPELESDELLDLVWEQVIDYTIADSNEYALSRRFYPELNVAFDISEPQQLAWAFSRQSDNSLYQVASAFITRMKENGDLKILEERYYGHVERFDYVGTRTYMRHILQRLPEFRDDFERAAEENNIDWRLLAAIGYQESHWNPKARSPTGVRGLMMLTTNTAEYIGISDRLDPQQSIEGGGKYVSMMIDKIPPDIPEPDRTWMGLAAYNVGYGHLEDARVITEIRGGDPDSWKDVKKNLPLLSRKKWYQKTRHGYARGREPLKYVENIRSYYDILVWYTEQTEPPVTVESVDVLNLDPSAL
ncbi:MAG: membrane-bound lytic murein transglycosylase MltF [Granulosicoccaceae bacterium]